MPCGVDIFTIGKNAEAGIVDVLRKEGRTVFTTANEARAGGFDPARWNIDPDYDPDGQMHITHPDHPHISGYLDGILINHGKPEVLEIKTMASHKFYRCKEMGICTEYPQYRTQIQIYLNFTGLKRGMFVYAARGEDGSVDPSISWFLNREFVWYDEKVAREAIFWVENAVLSRHLPAAPKKCQPYCRYYDICNHTAPEPAFPIPTCRTCRFWWECCRLEEAAQTVCVAYSPIADILPAKIRKSYYIDEEGDHPNKWLSRYMRIAGYDASLLDDIVLIPSPVRAK